MYRGALPSRARRYREEVTDDAATARSGRVDPRPAQTRDLVLQADRMIIAADGQAAVTPTRLVEYSGVARSTIYRYWPDAASVIADAIEQENELLPFQPTGDVETDLRDFLSHLVELLESPTAAIIVAQADVAEREEQAARALANNGNHRREQLRKLLDDRSDDFVSIHARIIGPLFMQRFFNRLPITAELIESIVAGYMADRAEGGTES